MIDTNKTYRTKDGQAVTELTKFGAINNIYPFVGVAGQCIYHWNDKGTVSYGDNSALGLIEVKPEQWYYIYKLISVSHVDISANTYKSAEAAEYASYHHSKGFNNYLFLGTWKLPADNQENRE